MAGDPSVSGCLHWQEWGDRRHPLTVLMLHGHPGNADCMEVFAQPLQAEAWVVAPDLRGYGKSLAKQPFPMTAHLNDLQQLLDNLQIKRCLLLGWSLGGILALELALQQPERVMGLVLVASAARPRSDHPPVTLGEQVNTGIASLLNWGIPGWQWNIDTFGKPSLYRYLIHQHRPDTYRYLARAALPAYLQTSRYARQALSQALRQGYNQLPQLAQLSHPALVMAGSQDRHIIPTSSQETAEHLPQATFKLYPDTAHLFPWEIPDQVQQDLKQWLREQAFLSG